MPDLQAQKAYELIKRYLEGRVTLTDFRRECSSFFVDNRRSEPVPRMRAHLDEIIDRYLAGELTFREFEITYANCYIDNAADAYFSSAEVDHYGAVLERSEWTSPSPSEEERGYGYFDPSEFKTWSGVHQSSKPTARS